MNPAADIWAKVLALMQNEMTTTTINTWFDDTTAVELEGDRFVLYSPTPFKRDIIASRYLPAIQNALRELFSAEFQVTVLTEGELDRYQQPKKNDLIPGTEEYTFERFVVGSSNKFAHAAARAVAKIKEARPLPVVVDIHFDYKLALEAIAAGADKVRINPGNIGGEDRVKAVADACRLRGIPIRIGVNGGSLEKGLLAKYGGVCPEAMVESAFGHIRLLNKFDFDDICVSLKSSSVPMTMRAYQLMREKSNYPLHIGVTEAGTVRMGTLKSAVGIGGLLALGIGDTMRVSLSADPVEEVYAARDILKAAGVRREGAELVSCPTCGRTRIDLIGLAAQVEERLKGVDKPITVAVMGCAVNGPGEASAADCGIAGGIGEGLLFRKGEIVKKVPQDRLVDELFALIEELYHRGRSTIPLTENQAQGASASCPRRSHFYKCLLPCASGRSWRRP